MIQVSSSYVYQRVIYDFKALSYVFCIMVAPPKEQQEPCRTVLLSSLVFLLIYTCFFITTFQRFVPLFCLHTSIFLYFIFPVVCVPYCVSTEKTWVTGEGKRLCEHLAGNPKALYWDTNSWGARSSLSDSLPRRPTAAGVLNNSGPPALV